MLTCSNIYIFTKGQKKIVIFFAIITSKLVKSKNFGKLPIIIISKIMNLEYIRYCTTYSRIREELVSKYASLLLRFILYVCIYTHTSKIHEHTINGAYNLLLVLESKIQILDETQSPITNALSSKEIRQLASFIFFGKWIMEVILVSKLYVSMH